MDLLRIPFVKAVLGSRWFPIAVRIVMLLAFGLIIAGGLGITTDDGAFAKTLRNTNLANLLVWSYWWPAIVLTAVVLGRVWCTVCPMELVTTVAGRLGLRRKPPGFFQSGWLMTVLYALILLVGVHTLAIHRLPHRMALYMLALLGAAVVVGLIFEKRTFCTYVCPVGHLLGLYAHSSILEWRSADTEQCGSCKSKDCVAKERQYRLVGRSCTSNLYPGTLSDNRDCLVCTECLKACPYGNLRLSLRMPFADFFRPITLKGAHIAFVVLLSGFVVYEILSSWGSSKAVLKWVPNQLVAALDLTGPAAGFTSAAVMFVGFPALLFAVVLALAKLTSGLSAKAAAQSFALLLLPTMACAHVMKSMLKMTSRIPYWRHALADPRGVDTANAIVEKTVVLDKAWPKALAPVLSCALVGLLILALGATWQVLRRSPATAGMSWRGRVPLLFGACSYWAVFAVTIVLWRFLS